MKHIQWIQSNIYTLELLQSRWLAKRIKKEKILSWTGCMRTINQYQKKGLLLLLRNKENWKWKQFMAMQIQIEPSFYIQIEFLLTMEKSFTYKLILKSIIIYCLHLQSDYSIIIPVLSVTENRVIRINPVFMANFIFQSNRNANIIYYTHFEWIIQ